MANQLDLPLPKPKLKHIVAHRSYCHGTERYEVIAYCGYFEEASGSGRHTVDVGDTPCDECKRREKLDTEPCGW